jgi:hypothetical protein
VNLLREVSSSEVSSSEVSSSEVSSSEVSSSEVSSSELSSSQRTRALPEAVWPDHAIVDHTPAESRLAAATSRSQRLRAIAQLDATARALSAAARRRNGLDAAPAISR